MRGRGFSFHDPVNSGEAGGHRSKPEVVPALQCTLFCRILVGFSDDDNCRLW